MKILIAEDDEDQLLLRCMLLSRSGFETFAAGDTGQAMDLAQKHKPECAVVDLRLPTQEAGLRLVRDLKRLNPAMFILVLTGADARSLARAPEYGLIDGVLTKGSSSAALVRKLNHFAGERTVGENASRAAQP
jgi:two-component system response regulator RegA